MVNGRQYTQAFEGCTLTATKDTEGWEIGWGHNDPNVVPGLVWTQDQADRQFEADYTTAFQVAAEEVGLGTWYRLDPIRQAALTDMAYELGQPRFAEFQHMLAAVRASSWKMAHDQCLDSVYAHQVPVRAGKNASVLLTGQWP